ncbi:macrolide transport system ATP-binding/permease protein [Rhizobium sp. RU20A]|uniref:MacB family efflux pump subunit n=1 Tax=Rhizobium sp. RU20A TaxID=1907412 RepID=UPI000956E80D|nr:MacB family efflux pump subunit [Rhizobium sp. RU20A]SIQ71894.1 macrolide transport system ATP-binding/permease protein [Rhizobium sp. RU20A]
MALLSLRDIRRSFVNGEAEVEVLKGLTLDIEEGEFVAIVGASGSGKSTLMNILGCLDRPTSGTYAVAGEDVADLDTDQLSALRRRLFGFVFQSYNLVPTLNALENVELPAVYAGLPASERKDRAAALLGSLGLSERLHHRPGQLSGGQQQRVSIARALMNGGRIILADEPTGALDSSSGRDVMARLSEMHRAGHTVIIITHAAEVAEAAERIIEISDGEIVADRPSPSRDPRIARLPRRLPTEMLTQTSDGASIAGDLPEAARMSLRSLAANLLRTALTLLGIVIGVSSVVAMLAIGTGAQNQVLGRIASLGSDLLIVRPNMQNFRGGDGGSVVTLVPADADAIRELPNIASAVPEMSANLTVRAGRQDTQTSVNGTTPDFIDAKAWPLEEGSFISADDMAYYRPVAVLGQTAATALFGEGTDPIGRYIIVRDIPFQVIGLLSKKGATAGGNDQDDTILVPLTTGSLRLFGQRNVRTITVKVEDSSAIAISESQILDLLNKRHGREDTQITNLASIRDTIEETSGILKIFLGSVAAISLLVGGIGVMNIMLVSVTERTREIGIRMATGARPRDILAQFIVEALVVSSIGGLVGIGLGLGIALLASQFAVPVSFSFGPVVLAFTSAFLTGLVFGFLPARNAARLDPAIALAAK